MKKFISLQLLIIALIEGVFMGTAHSSVFSDSAISYVKDSLLEQDAKEAIIATISNDLDAKSWITKFNSVIYSLSTLNVPETKNQKVVVRKTLERDTIKRALLVAQNNLALDFDNGRLDRKIFTDKEAADYALRVLYFAKIKGLQSSANIVERIAVCLAWVGVESISNIDEPLPEKHVTDNYCEYLYKRAQNFFNKGDYVQALETFKQIHFMSWANIKAYLGASICFLKMDRPDDAGKLALEVLSVLSNDMTPDEIASVSQVLYHSGNKDDAFKFLLNAYETLKRK